MSHDGQIATLWYHQSEKPIDTDFITEVRMPVFQYQDVDEPCFALAPTVWQCVYATSRKGKHLIYQLEVVQPESAEGDARDFDLTHEHRITQRVLDANGGKIPITYLGCVEIGEIVRGHLKFLFHAKRLTCNALQERDFLWKVSGEQWAWRGLSTEQLERELAQRPA